MVIALLLLAACGDGCHAARQRAAQHDIFEMRKAIRDFHEDKKRWPRSLDELARERYLHVVPKNPFSGKPDWVVVRRDGGVIDVKRP